MRRRLLASLLACACVAVAAYADEPHLLPATTSTSATLPTAVAVMDRFVAVTGGAAAHASIRTRRATGQFIMPDLGVDGTFEHLARRDGAARLTIDLPNLGVSRQGVSAGGVVWSVDATDGPRVLHGDEAAGVKRALAIEPDLSLDGYASVRVVDVVDLNGHAAYRMDLLDRLGVREQRFFDVETGLLVRTVAQTPATRPASRPATTTASELDAMAVATYFSDYNDVPPVRVPMRIRQAAFGLSPELVVKHVEDNVELPDALFEPPAEVPGRSAKRRGDAMPKG
jgi:hypothetical protein